MEWLSNPPLETTVDIPVVSYQVPYGLIRVSGQWSDACNYSQAFSVML